jgi:hypothetical protein
MTTAVFYAIEILYIFTQNIFVTHCVRQVDFLHAKNRFSDPGRLAGGGGGGQILSANTTEVESTLESTTSFVVDPKP